MARITMKNAEKASFAQIFELYISAVTARGVKDKTLATYKQHFHAISKRLDVSMPIHKLSSSALDKMILQMRQDGLVADVKNIPQFGKIETILNVPSYFVSNGNCCVDYPQLGFFLKPDVTATLVANTKFGENHGKAASILGITNCIHKRIVPSALTYTFASLEHDKKEEIIKRLLFRIPVVQIILFSAKSGKVNGYDSMSQLKESTKHRRSQCLRAIFKMLKEYDNTDLSARIDNIVWEDE